MSMLMIYSPHMYLQRHMDFLYPYITSKLLNLPRDRSFQYPDVIESSELVFLMLHWQNITFPIRCQSRPIFVFLPPLTSLSNVA